MIIVDALSANASASSKVIKIRRNSKFTEKDVEFWKNKAETRFNNYTPNGATTTETVVESNGVPASTSTSDVELPF